MYRLKLTTIGASVWRGVGLAVAAFVSVGSPLLGATTVSDWPQLLGPQRDGVYLGPPLAKVWPKEGPPVVWKREVGPGLAGPAVSGERLILFHRREERAVVECLDSRTGKAMWKGDYATEYRDDFGFDEGPRATPTIADGRVFTYGAEGRLSCWQLATGALLWTVDAVKEFASQKGFFGRAASPLVESDLVILMPGGREGAGVVALDVATGKVRWKATGDEASYASPTVADIRGRRIIFALTREALVALQPKDGQIIFRHPWRPRGNATVSAATPLVLDDFIFLSASYGAGASLLRFQERGPVEIWSRDDALSNHYATSVQHNGFLFGWHGRQEQGCELRCVELKTGKVRWSEAGLKAGSVTLAGEELLLLTEKGLLIRVPATPAGFKASAQAQILPSEVRALPALANGYLFARSKAQLVCLDLRAEP